MTHKPPIVVSHGEWRDHEPDGGRLTAAAGSPAPRSGVGAVVSFPDRKERMRKRQVRQGSGGSPRRWLSWKVVAITAGLVAVLMLLVLFSPMLALRTITVDGLKFISEEQVQATLAPLKGKPLTQIGQGDVESLVTSVPQVQSISVEARPPSTLLVHIVERVPVAVLKTGDQYTLVDPKGVPLGTSPDPASAQLPLIDGSGSEPSSDQRSQDTFTSVTSVLAALPQDVRARMASATASSPDAVELTLTDGKKVIWGDASQMALKAKVLKVLMDNALTQQPGKPDAPAVQVYDVSSPQRPVTR